MLYYRKKSNKVRCRRAENAIFLETYQNVPRHQREEFNLQTLHFALLVTNFISYQPSTWQLLQSVMLRFLNEFSAPKQPFAFVHL